MVEAAGNFHHQSVRNERLEGLLQIADVNAVDIDLGYLSERLVALAGAVRGTIYVTDKASDEMVMMDFLEGSEHKTESRIPLDESSIAGKVVLGNELINIADVENDH